LETNDDEDEDEDDLVEPTSWTSLVYSSFFFMAAAGQKEESLVEEENLDRALLGDIVEIAAQISDERRYKDDDESESEESNGATQGSVALGTSERKDARLEMAIISYFHRLSKKIFEVSSDMINDEDTNDEPEYGRVTNVHGEELRPMGLDVWSKADREFIKEFFALWYQREVNVDRAGIECCGMRIC
jgi:hypothetical protein